jgi:hypothetical protein
MQHTDLEAHLTRILIALALAAVAAIGLTAAVSAAKPEQGTINVDCGADGTFVVGLTPGNGTFTPAPIVGGGNLIPVAFSNQVSTFTDNEGNTFTENEPDASHPAPANKDLLSCHFEATFSDDTGSGTFSGDVIAFMVGHPHTH